jgi:probable phosphoglycerate mutase
MNIYLLRHGQTACNQERRLQGLRDMPLNSVGIRQSRRLVEWHRKTAVTRIVSSPLVRDRRIAEILGEYSGPAPLVDDRLREIDHGPWTGLQLPAIEQRFPHEFAAWSFFPEKLRLSSGESLGAVYRCCSRFLMDVLNTGGSEDVLVVSHDVVKALLLCAALGAFPRRIREFSLPNATISTLRTKRRKIVAVERELDAITE